MIRKERFFVRLSFLHSLCEIEGKYSLSLRDKLSGQEKLNHSLMIVKRYANKNNISVKSLEFFTGRKGGGIPYIQWSPSINRRIEDIIVKVLSSKHEIGDQFFLEKLYRHVLSEDINVALPFEIAIRRKFFSIYKRLAGGLNEKERDSVFNKGYSALINMLKDIRNRLKIEFVFDTDIIEHILDKPIIADEEFNARSFDSVIYLLKKHNIPLILFRNIHSFMMMIASLDIEEEIAEYFDGLVIGSIEDIRKVPHSHFIPYLREEAKDYILKIIRNRAKRYRATLEKEKQDALKRYNTVRYRLKDSINEGIKDLRNTMPMVEAPTEKTAYEINSTILKIHKNLTGNLWFLSDYRNTAIKTETKLAKNLKLLNMSFDDIVKELQKRGIISSSEILNGIDGYDHFGKFSLGLMEQWKKGIIEVGKKTLDELKYMYDHSSVQKERNRIEKEYDRVSEFFIFQTFKKDADIEELHKIYSEIMGDKLSLYSAYNALINSVNLWEEFKENTKRGVDEANYVAINLFPYKRFVRFSTEGRIYPVSIFTKDELKIRSEVMNAIFYRYAKGVSVLVYDIRGSSFMSARLRNAVKQKEIMNSFNSYILKDIKRYGVFPLKEMGDGGICWFADNSQKQYMHLFSEITTTKGIKIRHSLATGALLDMESGEESSTQAIKASIRMVQSAEEFIQKNYINYRDWFEEIKQMEIEHEGQTYALLPPEFRSLFRIGVGIATGIPGRDVDLGLNSVGDIDVFGSLINNATIFSGGRDPSQSIIIMDHNTLFHYLLNTKDIQFHLDKKISNIEELVIAIMNYMNKDIREYELGSSIIEYYGYFTPLEKDKRKSLHIGERPVKVYIDKEGTLYRDDGEEIVLLFSCTL